jgi:hypothetical protein
MDIKKGKFTKPRGSAAQERARLEADFKRMTQAAGGAPNREPGKQQDTQAQRSKRRKVMVISVAAVLAVVVLGLAGFLWSYSRDDGLIFDNVYALNVNLGGMTQEQAGQMFRDAVGLANATVYDQSRQFEEFEGMGTTLVAAYVEQQMAVIANVGDSRCYFLNREGVRCLTTDHSLVQLMVQRGELSREQAKNYPGKNLITRAIGTESGVECDLFYQPVQKGDCLLLCSDGLSNLLDDQEILFEVVHGVNKQLCCQRLLGICRERGAPDNVTSVLIVI